MGLIYDCIFWLWAFELKPRPAPGLWQSQQQQQQFFLHFISIKKAFWEKKLRWRIIGLENVRNLKLKDDDHLKKAAQGLRAGVGVLGSALPNFACLYLPLNAVP